MPDWRSTLGALTRATGTTFRVWAPERRSIEVVLETRDAIAIGPEPVAIGIDAPPITSDVGAAFRRPVLGHLKVAPTHFTIRPLTRDTDGYWSATFDDVSAGTLYKYRLDGSDDQVFPDPAARFQPFGVHGPSEVVDSAAFQWTDGAWQAPSLDETIFYELHVGTFTREGTFRAAVDRLSYLKQLGVRAIEIMPVADFPGDRNWGYDGVAIFAPARCYGTPEDLRALVDAAHAHDLAVYLDVVYNHLGPDGAYATVFSPYYFSNTHTSPWGAGVNLDGPHSAGVRRFFIENALHWVREYHIDGLRLDATHALVDDSPTHFLAELTTTVRTHSERTVTFVAEDHRNLSHMLQPVDRGGFGIDAVWADDFHHQTRVHAAADRDGYFADYTGTVDDLVTTLRQGWFFSGQHSVHHRLTRGTDPSPLDPHQFVICIQNHDQVGNRADGARLHHAIEPAAYRSLSVLLLMAPQTPLLFMGQEWAASVPFLFFTDHHDELGRKVTEGRRAEFGSFAAFRDPHHRLRIPDPQDRHTFERSRLMWDEIERPPHAAVHRLYEQLIAIRRRLAPARRDGYTVDALDDHTIVLRRSDRSGSPIVVIARLSGGPADVPVPGDAPAHVLLTTEDVDVSPVRLRFSGAGAIILGSPLAIEPHDSRTHR